jgi:phosphoribosyl-ATP pyrophosphohydrolase
MRLSRWFSINSAKTRDVSGNIVVGDVNGILLQNIGPPPAPLSLPWRDLASGPGDLGIFNLLTWRSRIAKTLVGRDDAFRLLLDWAQDDPRPIAIRLLSGPGGAGKSRLAAEVAETLRQKAWSTGLIALDTTTILPASDCGVFIAVDYPEANRAAVQALLKGAGQLECTAGKIRILLVSRQPMQWWQDDIITARASELCDTQEITLAPLPVDLTCALVRQVATSLAELRKMPVPTLDDSVIAAWRAGHPELHGLPLFTTAAAIHAVLDPAPTFSLKGPEIIEALVDRERMRLNMAARNAGWPSAEAGSRLHGLAALRVGLDERALQHLASAAPDIGLPAPERVVDNIKALGWWHNHQLRAPQPDIVAAELLYQILVDHPQAAQEWLAATLTDSDAVEVERLGRLLHDMATLRPDAPSVLTCGLSGALRNDPKRAMAWKEIFYSGQLTFRLAPIAVAIGRIFLNDHELAKDARALVLNNLSNHLSNEGDQAGALKVIQEAVEIYRRLAEANAARFEQELAGSLNNLSVQLRNAGDRKAGLEAIQEAVEIDRRLAQTNAAQFEPDLARSLNNLSIWLAADGDTEAALAAVQEAVEIRRRLTQANAARFGRDLAGNLNNLSNRLAETGDKTAALVAIQEAVEIRRRLAQANAAQFEPDLAQSLNNLSVELSDEGDHKVALKVIQEAVEIDRRLAQANPARFAPQLAMSLNNLSNALFETGDEKAAFEAIHEAVEIRRRLAQANPARFKPILLKTLERLMNRESKLGNEESAVAASREIDEIRRS